MKNNYLIFIALFAGLVPASQAANKFVFKNSPCTNTTGNICDGSDWNHAWKELNLIDWTKVGASDVIKISGGPSGITYTSNGTLSKSGDPVNRLRIERATEPGHNGKVVVQGGFDITGSYITFDGIDKNMFEFYKPGTTYFYVNTNNNNDYFEIKNVYIHNTPDPSCWSRSIDIVSGSLSIDRSELFRSQCSEDIMRFTSSGSMKVEHSYIHGWEALYAPSLSGCTGSVSDSKCWSHSDMVEGGGTGHTMLDLTFRYNLLDDSINETTTSRGHNIAFMTGYTTFRDVDFSYNVIREVYQVHQAISTGTPYRTSKSINNVFYNSGFGRFTEVKNNIFAADSSFYAGNSMTYCLWSPGTGSFVVGTGNFQGDPKFLNPSKILGDDGIPFTADDGFNLQNGSPAINKGTTTGQTVDIRGNSMSGIPDLGAYEFGGTTPPLSNSHPADTNSDYLMALNESTKYGACWKNPAAFGDCPAGIAIDYAVRAGTLWAGSATGQYQYNSNQTCPLCWEVKP